LQQYQNLHAIVLPANIQDFLNKVENAPLTKGPFPYKRIGSGEFTDSLLFDHITEYSKDIIEFFRERTEYFEFKTKSANISNLLKTPPAQNIVIGWSVNPQNIITSAEPLTPPLQVRLQAAKKVAQHGFKTAFHFDPVILHEGWQDNYTGVVKQIADTVPQESIAWVSIGTLRFNRDLKKIVEARFKDNTILDGEFLLDFDGKMRYPKALRAEVYKQLSTSIKKHLPNTKPYLCMETADLQI
jgi:spore photoproduct lyase